MKKETIKYFDIVLSKIENYNEFSIGVILSKLLNPDEKDQKEVIEFNKIVENVNLFGRNEDFFKPNGVDPWNSLTPEGKIAKKLGGYFEYEKHIEKKELESTNKNITNNNFGGTLIQDSDLKNARIINKPKTENNIPLKKSLIQKLLSNPWLIGIIFAIIAALLNADRVMKFINEKVDGL